MTSVKAVLTADIVNSSLIDRKQLDNLLSALKDELKRVRAKNDFYRGDSFHVLYEAEHALALSLRLRTIAKFGIWQDEKESIDIRIAIGIGSVQEPFKDMATANGEAFMLSGRELDLLNKSSARLALRCMDKKIDAGLEGLALLADLLVQKMSPKQSEAVAELLLGATQMEAAKKLGKSQSTINKLARAANWGELDKAIQIYRKLVLLFTE